ncbi:MAG: endonuclease domain-containing protein [Alphaproteobacteria bacterium]
MRKEQKLKNAKKLRKQLTEAERRIWHHLRAHRFQGVKFKRQCPIGPYICDFVSLNHKLIIELDGGQHASATTYDRKRDSFLKEQGFRVLRFWNHDVLAETDGVLQEILRLLHSPLPNPLPQAGEGT